MPIDVNGDNDARTLNGGTPLIPIGGEVMFRVALFDKLPAGDDVGEFRNHALVVTAQAKIHLKAGQTIGGVLLDSAVDGTVALDPSVTETQFKSKQKAPISIYFSSAKIAGVAAGTHFIKFHGITSESVEADIFGWSDIAFKDVGTLTAGAPSAGNPAYVTQIDLAAVVASCVRFGKNPVGRMPIFVSPNGAAGVEVGSDNNGDLVINRKEY